MTGKEAEQLFEEIAGKVIKSSREEDMFDHWDYEVEGVKYDVKTEKKLNRQDESTSPDVIWLEWMNVRGDKGWLQGKADKIAFLSKDTFYIVDRSKLAEFTLNLTKSNDVYFTKQYAKWYRRRNRKDVVTYVFLKDILHLVENTWIYKKNPVPLPDQGIKPRREDADRRDDSLVLTKNN